MSKYDPLTKHLTWRNDAKVPMTFTELEMLLGFPLPPSARKHRGWWSNNPDNNVMTRAWIDAGYRSEEVNIVGEKLVFHQQIAFIEEKQAEAGFAESPPIFELKPRRHPLFGALKGMISIEEGYDLTLPADPDWGDVYK